MHMWMIKDKIGHFFVGGNKEAFFRITHLIVALVLPPSNKSFVDVQAAQKPVIGLEVLGFGPGYLLAVLVAFDPRDHLREFRIIPLQGTAVLLNIDMIGVLYATLFLMYI